MGFINPAFLFSLIALAIPLLIHILSRRRVPEVPFSTLRFLTSSSKRSMKRINFRRLFLLILRMLIILFLALGISRPVVRGGLARLFPADAPRNVCLLIDVSYSMRFEDEAGQLFERAKRSALNVIHSLKERDRLCIIAFNGHTRVIYSGQFSKGEAVDVVNHLQVGWGDTDIEKAYRQALSLLSSQVYGANEIYIISDFQAGALPEGGNIRMGSGMGGYSVDTTWEVEGRKRNGRDLMARVFLIPVRAVNTSQVAITDVKVPEVKLHRGELVKLDIYIKNFSDASKTNFTLEAKLEGQRILEREVEIGANELKSITVEFPVDRFGWLKGTVSKSRDRLRPDDSRYFALKVEEKMRTLLVADKDKFYLSQALNPDGTETDIELSGLTWDRLTASVIRRYDVVVLGPAISIPMGVVDIIKRFAAGGGKVVVVVSPELKVLASELSNHRLNIRYVDLGAGFENLEKPMKFVPFLKPFSEDDWKGFLSVKFSRYPEVRGVPAREVYLRFANSYPFVWIEEHGMGTVVFVCLDPKVDAGDIVLSPYFLPLIQQLVLSAGDVYESVRQATIGEKQVIWGETGEELRAVMPDHAVVKARIVSMDEGSHSASMSGAGKYGRAQLYEIGTPSSPGYISIYRGENQIEIIPVNCNSNKEGDCRAVELKRFVEALGIEHYKVVADRRNMDEVIMKSREGTELTRVFLILALILVLIEGIVAQRHRMAE